MTRIREQVDATVAATTERFAYAVGANDTPLLPLALQAVRGGKRFRAICAWVGAAAALGTDGADEGNKGAGAPLTTATQGTGATGEGTEALLTPTTSGADAMDEGNADASALLTTATALPGLLDLATALECYQSSALVHDDVIDRSPTRRGEPASHAWLSRSHSESGGPGNASEYGQSGAILLGNLLVAAAEDSLARLAGVTQGATTQRLISHYAQMTGEVAQGQFRDMEAGFKPLDQGAASDRLNAALDVIRVKSALYSVVRPAQLGAILAGATPDLVTRLAEILEPAGLAFQLRDDDLGAFGTDALTGKPTGIDILERKRTVLLAITWNNADEDTRRTLERAYASNVVSNGDLAAVVSAMGRFGRPGHEALIQSLVAQSQERLDGSGLSPAVHELLAYLVGILTSRDA